jgi:hypothetical protein
MFENPWIAFGVLVAVVITERLIAGLVLAGMLKYYDWQDKRIK